MEGLNLNSFQGGDSWDSTSKLIKEELLDDDYFKIPVPKVEPVFEQCEPTSSCSPPQKRRKYEQKLSWRQIIQSSVSNSDDSETQKRSKSEDQVQCRLCQQLNHSRQMKTFVSEMEKLLLMLAHLLNKTYSLEEAQSFILNVTNHHFICTIHFYESIDSIYSALDGRIVNGLFECSTEALEEFMITVNSLCHCMTPLKLCDVLYQFKLKNKWIPNTLPINTIYRQRHASSIVITENHEECCSFCHQSKKPEELKYVSLKTEKLVFMIASIIRNECTSLQGARFIYEKSEKAVCRDHFTEVILDIFAVPLEKVMRIVRSLGSKITPQEFKIALKYFILKNDGSSKESNPITQITKNDSIKLEVDDSIEETKFSHTEDFMKLSENRANRSNTPVEHLPARSISNGLPFQALIQQKHPVVRCSICSQIEESPNLTAISQNDKLILMVKSILCNENTVEQARQFMYDKNDHLICIRHLSETVRAIYKNLHISNYERMVSSSLDILMKIVESFRVILTLEDFLKVFKEFVSVNTITCTSNDLFNTANNLDSSASAPKYFPGRKRRTQCAICFQWIEWQFTKCLHLEDTKFVVIVACILSGRCTPEQAKTFVSNKDYRSVCISHFSDVFDEIQKCIGFGDMKDIFHCGDGPKRRIMTAVNSVAPMIKFTSFCETFLSFLNGNKKLMIAVFDSANCSERKDNIESTSSQVSAVKEEGTNGEIPNADPHQVVSDFGYLMLRPK
ncbi:hypothetical protein GCK72_019831 [Caenorhabditis remanei]|uniref:Lin-15A/B-like domain-containing protein n=1 Tax=Caenorhabditis remanei TaxID=31234 RepID=A0A6A5GF15_CAERE|nr:hypothetical protein GCK72_019831 [Caenorhabditis remanei]KAF1753275.1 hypothetical protein GCK72_019831 [Caenorhabditis remanei]